MERNKEDEGEEGAESVLYVECPIAALRGLPLL